MINNTFSSWPSYSQEEVDAVSKTLLSNKVNYWTGNECREFEKEFALWSNTKYAVSLANGTLALDLALKSLNIGSNDEVIVTSRTFIASVSSIINVGATPIFADIDIDSQNINHETILKKISNKTKAILCVHLAGWPCEMDDIMLIAKKHGLYVIEDCAQAHGAKYKGRPVGSIGHIGCWSFCQDKIITTGGEGGMVTTNDKSLWKYIWAYKDHGKSYEAVYDKKSNEDFKWLHESFGSNYRMLEMQAVIGRIQLKRMKVWRAKRIENASKIWEAAKECRALRVPKIPDYIDHAAYKCYVFVEPSQLKSNWSRNRIIREMLASGVPCYSGSCSEIYMEKAFDNTEFRPIKRLSKAKELAETSLMFLVHPTLLDIEIKKTCNHLMSLMNLASK